MFAAVDSGNCSAFIQLKIGVPKPDNIILLMLAEPEAPEKSQ